MCIVEKDCCMTRTIVGTTLWLNLVWYKSATPFNHFAGRKKEKRHFCSGTKILVGTNAASFLGDICFQRQLSRLTPTKSLNHIPKYQNEFYYVPRPTSYSCRHTVPLKYHVTKTARLAARYLTSQVHPHVKSWGTNWYVDVPRRTYELLH